jgi:putative ABC transport system substrate-binding protein
VDKISRWLARECTGDRVVDRRAFIVGGVAGLTLPRLALAQQTGKVYRVGVLSPEVPPPGFLDAFREGLRDFGHVDGQTISLELRDAGGVNERLPDLARELIALNVDVIIAINTPAARAAKGATATIPIVINTAAGGSGNRVIEGQAFVLRALAAMPTC